MVKAELSYNPYLLETKIKLNNARNLQSTILCGTASRSQKHMAGWAM